jgi:hypothetical protein
VQVKNTNDHIPEAQIKNTKNTNQDRNHNKEIKRKSNDKIRR